MIQKQEKNEINQTTKLDQGKVSISCIPQRALLATAEAFTYGANKYGRFNYSGNIDSHRYYDACQRHLIAWIMGEDIDESGNSHLSHAIASLMLLEEGMLLKTITDTRNKIYTNLNKSDVRVNKRGNSTPDEKECCLQDQS